MGRVPSNSAPSRNCVSFSNRCFPTKAVAIWGATSDEQHVQLVGSYFQVAGGWEQGQARAFQAPGWDPLFAVWARRRAEASVPGTPGGDRS